MSRILLELGMPAAFASAYQESPRASRACRIREGMPGGEDSRLTSGLGGMSWTAADRICACRARSSSVNVRLMCFSCLSLIAFPRSRLGDFVCSHRNHGIAIDLFVHHDDIPAIGNVAENTGSSTGAAGSLRFIVLQDIIHIIRRQVVRFNVL